MKFSLSIKLGNEAMRNGRDFAHALRQVAANVGPDCWIGQTGTVRDLNGNTVGEWKVTK